MSFEQKASLPNWVVANLFAKYKKVNNNRQTITNFTQTIVAYIKLTGWSSDSEGLDEAKRQAVATAQKVPESKASPVRRDNAENMQSPARFFFDIALCCGMRFNTLASADWIKVVNKLVVIHCNEFKIHLGYEELPAHCGCAYAERVELACRRADTRRSVSPWQELYDYTRTCPIHSVVNISTALQEIGGRDAGYSRYEFKFPRKRIENLMDNAEITKHAFRRTVAIIVRWMWHTFDIFRPILKMEKEEMIRRAKHLIYWEQKSSEIWTYSNDFFDYRLTDLPSVPHVIASLQAVR